MDNFEDATKIRDIVLSEVPNTAEKLPYESEEDFKIRQEILTDAPVQIALLSVEQPVNIEELLHALCSFSWSLADECHELDELLEVLQAKRAEKEALYLPKMKELEEQIKAEVIKQGKAFKCMWGAVTYKKGHDRVSWDSKALSGYAAAHPEIEVFKNITKVAPSVNVNAVFMGAQE